MKPNDNELKMMFSSYRHNSLTSMILNTEAAQIFAADFKIFDTGSSYTIHSDILESTFDIGKEDFLKSQGEERVTYSEVYVLNKVRDHFRCLKMKELLSLAHTVKISDLETLHKFIGDSRILLISSAAGRMSDLNSKVRPEVYDSYDLLDTDYDDNVLKIFTEQNIIYKVNFNE